jgi:cell filamentation protein
MSSLGLAVARGPDPYVYEGTSVLINKQGITDKDALRAFEYENAATREHELLKQPLPEKFDYAHLKSIHRHLFQDTYDWAGEQRTVDLSKGGTTFERARRLDFMGGVLSEKIEAQNNLQGLDKKQFVDKISVLYSELNALHPHREGNGRAARFFLGQLARVAGYELDQHKIDNQKGEWNLAAKMAVDREQKDLEPIKAIFNDAIRPSRSVAFETLPRAEAMARHPELARNYAEIDAVRKQLPDRYPGNKKAQDHFFMQAITEAIRKLDQGTGATRATINTNAAVVAIGKKIEADGLTEQQRQIVMARVQQNAARSLEKGVVPTVKPYDDKYVAPTRGRELER